MNIFFAACEHEKHVKILIKMYFLLLMKCIKKHVLFGRQCLSVQKIVNSLILYLEISS